MFSSRQTILSAVVFLAVSRHATADWVFPTDLGQVQYESSVTHKILSATPSWKESELHPPLAAREALRLGDAQKDLLLRDAKCYDTDFFMKEASLVPLDMDKWIWVIGYEGRAKGAIATTGVAPFIELVVLMNGEVVPPRRQQKTPSP